MAQVQISDVIVPAEFTAYQVENSFVSTAFFQSGVALRNGVIDDQLLAGSESFTVPVWGDLPDAEANYSTDNPADIAQPQKISAYAQVVRKAFVNNSWAQADLAAELSGSNPLQRIQERVQAYWDRQLQMRLIASLRGIIAANIANNESDMILDVTNTDAPQFAAEAVIEAAGTLGDRLNDIKAIAMHSSVYAEALKNDLIEFLPQSQGAPLRTFRGLAVVIDDSLWYSYSPGSENPVKYLTILFGQGAVGYGVAAPRAGTGTELFRIPSAGNGGGITQLWSRNNLAIAPVGWSFTSNSVGAESPTLAELALATNWNRISISRKACPIAFLLTL